MYASNVMPYIQFALLYGFVIADMIVDIEWRGDIYSLPDYGACEATFFEIGDHEIMCLKKDNKLIGFCFLEED